MRPRSKLLDMLAQVEAIAAANDVRITTIAHAADGNLHPLILTPTGDDAARIRAHVAFEQLLDAALALGGARPVHPRQGSLTARTAG